MSRSIILPITNVYAKGGFTIEVQLGSSKQMANLILDTGSSTLVVQHDIYQANNDVVMQPTPYCQDVIYGIGGWYGAVVKTSLSLGTDSTQVILANVHIAVTKQEMADSFGHASGFIGLAFHQLNKAYDVSDYLNKQNVVPAYTYPWHIQENASIKDFSAFLKGFPELDINPYFTQLEEQKIVANQFAFIIHRSSIYQTEKQKTLEELKQHPLNSGLFVLGNPETHSHFSTEHQQQIKVVHDKYYNVELHSVRVDGHEPLLAEPLSQKHLKAYISNAIVDSGASMLVLPEKLFVQLIAQLIQHNTKFKSVLTPYFKYLGKEVGIPIEEVDFCEWPDLIFSMLDINQQVVELTITPHTYWQTNAPATGQISFQITFLPNWPNQTILGLPFLNNFYSIFDRKDSANGHITFKQKVFTPHCLEDQIHNDISTMKALFKAHHHDI
jgi:hypothetical protein